MPTNIKIMIIATYGATLDGGTAYPAPFFVGPSDPPPVAISLEQPEA